MPPNQVTSAGQFAFSQLPPSLQGRQMDPFIYECDILNIGASSSASGSITINNDADFLIISICGVVSDVTNATQITYVPATILITDNGSGRAIASSPVPFNNIVGDAKFPAYLDYPKYLARSTSLTVQWNSLEAVIRNARLSFKGFKIFSAPAQ